MPTPAPDIQKKVAEFHKKYPAPAALPENFVLSPVRAIMDLPDPLEPAESFVEFGKSSPPNAGMEFSHAELLHDDARNLWNFILWFVVPMTEEQMELQAILKHGEQMEFDSYAKFLSYLREVLPLPTYNRARPLLDKAGITELLWQQERVGHGKTVGVRPLQLFKEALAKGGKPIMFGDKAEEVRRVLDERRKPLTPPPPTA